MGGRGGRGGGNSDAFSGGTYIVFVQREGKPTPVYIKTGLTDLDYSEVKSGLKEGDMVLMLPSASLIQGQQNLQNRMKSMSGGLPGQSNTTTPAAGGAGKGGATPAAGGAKPGGR